MGGPWCSGALPAHLQPRARYRRHRRRERRVRRLAVHVRHPDREVRRVGAAPAVRHPDRHRVARLLLVVQRRACPYLAAVGGRQDVERVRVSPLQGVGQHVAVPVRRRDRSAHVGVRQRVLGHAQRARPARECGAPVGHVRVRRAGSPSATSPPCPLRYSPAPAPRSVCRPSAP